MGYDLYEYFSQMQAGVAEIMETGHITLAETLCRIFCSDPGNKVYLFTIETHSANLSFLCSIYPNLNLVVKPGEQKVEDFLNDMGNYPLDRIYLVTLTKHFRIISEWQLRTKLYLVIHNTDEWFGNSLYESLKKFFYSISKTSQFNLWIYFFKVSFIFPVYKKEILRKVQKSDGRLVVLSRSVRKVMMDLKITLQSEVVPFAVFEPSLVTEQKSSPNQLRICVPGILSQYRRNYLAFLDTIELQLEELKGKFIVDFLGGVQNDSKLDNHALILNKIDVLRKKGFLIVVHPVQFIPPVEYDTELSKADIIVGNMNVTLNRYSIYGKTKETGIPFAMIKAAKPGILPETYPVPEELSTSTLVYHDFQDLGKTIARLISDRQIVEDLKIKALENSKKFSAESIYNQMLETKTL
jgi:hypothetical protein